MTNRVPYLKARWQQTIVTSGLEDLNDELFAHLVESYSEPQRKYHTQQHLEQCFQTLDDWFLSVPDRPAVELALWYHDFVYDLKGDGNERASAYMGKMRVLNMGGTMELAEKVQHLILLTEHKAELPRTRDEHILIDVDFSILASPSEAFQEYERQIREEYAMYPDELYKPGRASILARFLSRPSIFHSDEASWHENLARENLEASIRSLGYTVEEALKIGRPA